MGGEVVYGGGCDAAQCEGAKEQARVEGRAGGLRAGGPAGKTEGARAQARRVGEWSAG
jgi:hypothetical protein